LFRVLLSLLLAAQLIAAPKQYKIAPAAGKEFVLEVAKTGVYNGKKHRFVFERYQGRVEFDRDAPEKTIVEIAIKSASAVCTDTWVDAKDLKKIEAYALNQMMQATRYPELTFRSSRVRRRGQSQYDVEGMLTIRDIEKPALVTVTVDSSSPDTLMIEGDSEIKLKDFGLKPPTAGLGLVGTKNEMNVRFKLGAPASEELKP
jgi:polyisoprenoid-binding protein YceI